MIKRLFVIGDSFTVPCSYSNGWDDNLFWIEKLKVLLNLSNDVVSVDGIANRDVQTIIDNWIKLIPYLTNSDRLIICLPYFRRTRVALTKPHWYKSYKPYPDDINIINRFIGPQMFTSNLSLEFWGKDLDVETLSNMLIPQEIINSTYAAQMNQIEVIESLVKITPCKSVVFTWDEMEIKSNVIKDKRYLTKEISFWQTLHDEFIQTNGVIGKELDFHWGSRFNVEFAKWLFKIL